MQAALEAVRHLEVVFVRRLPGCVYLLRLLSGLRLGWLGLGLGLGLGWLWLRGGGWVRERGGCSKHCGRFGLRFGAVLLKGCEVEFLHLHDGL